MGRKLNKKVHQFFVYCPEDDKSVCNICRSRLSGRNITNIRRHLLSKHEDIYNESVNLEDCEPPETEQKRMKISYSTNEQAIVSSIIKIVTTDENPFMLLDSEGFNEIMEPIYNSLNMTPITSHSILKYISLDGQSLKGKIKTLVKGKLVTLKLDVATRLDKAILVVNLQFILHKSELFVKTLGIIQLEGSYTETYLKEKILHILNEYEINLDQVYSITSDDGRNIIKEVQLLNDATNESLFDDDMIAENVMKKLDAIQLTNVHLLRCPTQTLELCVLDVYKQSDIFEQINACRGVCKALRSGSYGRFLMEQKRNIPPLDVTTRWNTTYIMVQKLFELEEFLSMHPNIDVKPDWDWMELYVDAFKDIYEATLRLQDENLVSSEFFVIWQELKLKFENSRNYIKKLLLVRMRARESELLKSEALLAAIYMDPRVNHILTSEQKWLAKQNLKELAYRLYQSKKSNSSTVDIGNLPHPSGSDSNIQLVIMYADVENFCQMYTRLPLYSNILDFYNKLKLKLPHLNALAQVVLSTSANQVTIERAYAALQFILTEGSSLNHENINDVLLIKLNS